MASTQRFGLDRFGGSLGGSVADNGGKFSNNDRTTIDRVLAALEGHRHTGGAIATWQPHTGFDTGGMCTPTVPNGHVYLATVGGTSASSQPAWPTGPGQAVGDGTITWAEAGSDATTQLASPTGAPGAAWSTAPTASLPAGATFYYRCSFLDAFGLETAASPEVQVSTPDPVASPDPPAATPISGAGLDDGSYEYAITCWQSTGGGETPPSLTSTASVGAGLNQVQLDLPPLANYPGADAFRIYRMGPGEIDLYYVDQTTSSTWVDTGIAASATQVVPLENSTNTQNQVTITCPDVAGGLVPGGVARWRVYRASASGDYGSAALVAEVTETQTEGGGPLVTSTLDTGAPLLDGLPLDISTAFTPPGRVATPIVLGDALPLTDVAGGSAGTAASGARIDHRHPREGTGMVLSDAAPLVDVAGGRAGVAASGSHADHQHPSGTVGELYAMSVDDGTVPAEWQFAGGTWMGQVFRVVDGVDLLDDPDPLYPKHLAYPSLAVGDAATATLAVTLAAAGNVAIRVQSPSEQVNFAQLLGAGDHTIAVEVTCDDAEGNGVARLSVDGVQADQQAVWLQSGFARLVWATVENVSPNPRGTLVAAPEAFTAGILRGFPDGARLSWQPLDPVPDAYVVYVNGQRFSYLPGSQTACSLFDFDAYTTNTAAVSALTPTETAISPPVAVGGRPIGSVQLTIPGELALGQVSLPLTFGRYVTVHVITAALGTAPVGADLIVDIRYGSDGLLDDVDIADWQADTVYPWYALVQPPTPNGHRYRQIAGRASGGATSGLVEPTWPTSGTVDDGGCLWLGRGAADLRVRFADGSTDPYESSYELIQPPLGDAEVDVAWAMDAYPTDVYRLRVDQVGSTTPGSDLTVTLGWHG